MSRANDVSNAARPMPSSRDCAAWLEENHSVVREVAQLVCRRNNVQRSEESDFVASLFLKLIERDYAVLRQFRGGVAIRAFLQAVVRHHFLDWRNLQWGRWRPSEAARRKGEAAVELERLTSRDGHGESEAIAMLVSARRWGLSSSGFRDLHAQLPVRTCGHRRAELNFDLQPASNRTDAGIERRDLRRCAARVSRALAASLAALRPSDRRLLRMRFQLGMSISDIASTIGADPKKMYRHFARLLHEIRVCLEARRLTGGDIHPLLGHPEVLMPDPRAGEAAPVLFWKSS